MEKNGLFPKLELAAVGFNFDDITQDRKIVLQPLIEFIREKVSKRAEIRLNMICTHNSRRSHLAQVWAQAAAHYYGIGNVYCYSGGTEATAMFPVVVETLKETGFHIQVIADGSNPIYAIKYAENEHPIIGFSKKFSDEFNPEKGYVAIMTCSDADEGCPFIAGAEMRIPITYDDPKAYDGTSQQAEKYRERSLQIATEMFYVFSQINK